MVPSGLEKHVAQCDWSSGGGHSKQVASSCLDMFYACAGNVTETVKASSEGSSTTGYCTILFENVANWLSSRDEGRCAIVKRWIVFMLVRGGGTRWCVDISPKARVNHDMLCPLKKQTHGSMSKNTSITRKNVFLRLDGSCGLQSAVACAEAFGFRIVPYQR